MNFTSEKNPNTTRSYKGCSLNLRAAHPSLMPKKRTCKPWNQEHNGNQSVYDQCWNIRTTGLLLEKLLKHWLVPISLAKVLGKHIQLIKKAHLLFSFKSRSNTFIILVFSLPQFPNTPIVMWRSDVSVTTEGYSISVRTQGINIRHHIRLLFFFLILWN